MDSNITKIIVVGETGNGKSTLCNYILGEKKCKESKNSKSCTPDVSGHMAAENSKYPFVFMIDTPGLADSEGRDQDFIDKIRKELKINFAFGIKSIIIVQNVNIPRLSSESQRQIYLFCKMFSTPDFWYHVAIAFTFCYEFFPPEQFEEIKKQKEGDYIPNFIEKVTKITNEINEGLSEEKKIKVPGYFQTYYLDCGQVYPPFKHDRTDKQIQTLVSWSKNQEFIDFNKGDLNAKILCDYKKIEPMADFEDLKEERITDDEIKYTKKYYKRQKAFDFNNKEKVLIDDEEYNKEIYYKKQRIEFGEENKSEDKIEGNLEQKIVTIKRKKFQIVEKLDENKKVIETISKVEMDPEINTNVLKSEYTTKTEYRIIDKEPVGEPQVVYRTDETGVQEYFNQVRNMSTGEKVFFIGFNIAHFISGIGHLVAFVVSKLQKKKLFKIVYREYRKVQQKREVKTTDIGNIINGKWEFDKELDRWKEYDEPVRID